MYPSPSNSHAIRWHTATICMAIEENANTAIAFARMLLPFTEREYVLEKILLQHLNTVSLSPMVQDTNHFTTTLNKNSRNTTSLCCAALMTFSISAR
jgi:hypothetical protein